MGVLRRASRLTSGGGRARADAVAAKRMMLLSMFGAKPQGEMSSVFRDSGTQ